MPSNNDISMQGHDTYSDLIIKFNNISQKYSQLPPESIAQAFSATYNTLGQANPYIQNRRVKAISTLPSDIGKNKLAELLQAPYSNEEPLRRVAHALEYTSYPTFHTRKVYQDVLTYRNYTYPYMADDNDTKTDLFWREWKLVEKLRTEIAPQENAHQITGQALQEGKVFYYPRISIDKSHNKINYAFMQQLPSDWTKIVGFNNKSKYTIAFNLLYFTQPGTDYRQFGQLFEPYMQTFSSVVTKRTKSKNVIFAAKINLSKFNELAESELLDGNPDVYYQNGRWFYWVTLPPNQIFTFEVDDVNRTAISPFSGLFIDMAQLAAYEAIQLQLVQNPLISIITGEIPYYDTKEQTAEDTFKLSDGARRLFETLWYQMLMANNTNGIGIYMAPLANITLHQLAEAPSAMQISSAGYGYTMSKAGLTALIPTGENIRAGTVQVSLQIESRFAAQIYTCFERMMNCLIESLNLKHNFKFKMFGDIATDKDLEDKTLKGLEHGILSDTLIYLALHDKNIFDDFSISDALISSDIMSRRKPLIASYNMSNKSPDNADESSNNKKIPPEISSDINPGGRPKSTDITSEGHEADIDSYGQEI